MNLTAITRYTVPQRVVQTTDEALRSAGRGGDECFVLWTGLAVGTSFEVRTCYVPRQTAYRLPSGVCVRVEGEELFRLNRWLYSQGEVLGVQVHSHPTRAYHSETDDTYPIVTQLGGLSIVVPNFGRSGLLGSGVAVYRLMHGRWSAVATVDVARLLQLGT